MKNTNEDNLYAELKRIIDGYREENVLNVSVIGILELIKSDIISETEIRD